MIQAPDSNLNFGSHGIVGGTLRVKTAVKAFAPKHGPHSKSMIPGHIG